MCVTSHGRKAVRKTPGQRKGTDTMLYFVIGVALAAAAFAAYTALSKKEEPPAPAQAPPKAKPAAPKAAPPAPVRLLSVAKVLGRGGVMTWHYVQLFFSACVPR